MVACPSAFGSEGRLLSQNGKLRLGTKSGLVRCLEDLMASQEDATNPKVQVITLDGSVIVNMVRPVSGDFLGYGKQVFLQYIESQLKYAIRVELVWDEYKPDSLKAETRRKRGNGIRRRVEPSSLVPRNWQEFLRIDENKVELFSSLTTCIASIKSDNR